MSLGDDSFQAAIPNISVDILQYSVIGEVIEWSEQNRGEVCPVVVDEVGSPAQGIEFHRDQEA